MAQKKSWDLELRRAKLEYLFHAYVRQPEEGLQSRLIRLIHAADQIGDNRHWSAMVHVDGQRQEWIVFGFKSHDHKLRFDTAAKAIVDAGVSMADMPPLGVLENWNR